MYMKGNFHFSEHWTNENKQEFHLWIILLSLLFFDYTSFVIDLLLYF